MSILTAARERVGSALSESLYDNPVVTKAFRTRMRGWKAFVIMGAYAGLMTVILLIAYFTVAQVYAHQGMYPSFTVSITIGRSLFATLTWAQAFLLTLIIPALSSGSITNELEKKTIEMLALTPLSAGKIVFGKQVSDFLYALILLICSLPLSGICLMLGGVSPAEIAVTYLLLAAWAYLFTCSGVMWSSLSKRTAAASGNNFGLCLMYFIATLAVPSAILTASRFSGGGYSSFPFVLLNPAFASAGVLDSASICGVHVPTSLVAIILHAALGVMFLLIATTHVKYRVVERALPIRLLLIGLTVFVVWLSIGSSASNLGKSAVALVGGVLLALGMVASSVFATGALKKPEKMSMLRYVVSPRRAFRTDVGGGIGFITLWIALAYITFGLTALVWQRTSTATPMTGGKLLHGFWPAYFHVGVATLVIVAATAAVGLLATCIAKKRAPAAALALLFVSSAFAGYVVMAIMCESSPGHHPLAAQLTALWPLTPAFSASQSPHDVINPSFPPPHWIGMGWLVTSAVYAVIGAIALALASVAYRKTGGAATEE